MRGKRIGVDVGGTFTDMVLTDAQGNLSMTKVPSTVTNQAFGIMEAIRALQDSLHDVELVVHGTTVGTNAMIEKTGARTGLITTRGFRDILEIRRGFRPPPPYDLLKELPPPLVPRELRYEVTERIDWRGNVITPLAVDEVDAAILALRKQEVTAIAVCLLFSYVNPQHERLVGERLAALFPECQVSLSSDILPIRREYERTCVAVVNAYLMEKIARYLTSLQGALRDQRYDHDLLLVRASGGMMSQDVAVRTPVNLIGGGPAAGITAAVACGRDTGVQNLIGVDLGGTSCDIGVVVGGEPIITKDRLYEYNLAIPMVDITSIGAGGGSIAWLDAGGALKVGPQSAGANPGPACYGLGGTQPTLTDAYIALGMIDPEHFLGGRMRLKPELAWRALQSLAKPLGMSEIEVALGMLRTANSNMAEEIRLRVVERGFDPRDFALFPFGGAGPLHGSTLAAELGAGSLVVPLHPGLVSAMGCLQADLKYDYVQSYVKSRREAEGDLANFNRLFTDMEKQGIERLRKDGIGESNIQVRRWADVSYQNQSHELRVPVPPGELTAAKLDEVEQAFHAEHERVFTFANVGDPVVYNELYVTAHATASPPRWQPLAAGGAEPSPRARRGSRRVYSTIAGKFMEADIFDRTALLAGNEIHGPAIIEEMDSTTLLEIGQRAVVHRLGHLIVQLRETAA
jgi:N-methylhydantoinase A